MSTYLRTQEVAERLALHRRTVIKLAREHAIGEFVGGRVGFRFTPDDVTALEQAIRLGRAS